MKKIDPIYLELFPTSPKKGDILKFKIVECAIQSLAIEGIENTTFESIGNHLGIGKAHVRYHFKSKDSIIEAAIMFITRTAQKITIEEVQKGLTPKDKILGFSNGAFRWAQGYPYHVRVMLLFYYLASKHQKYQKLHSEMRRMGYERINLLLSETKIKGTSSVSSLAKIIQGIITNNIIEYFSTKPKQSLDRLQKETILQITRLLETR